MKNRILILFLLITSTCLSQEHFNEDYILISEQDTLFGHIDNGKLVSNSTSIKFRTNENSNFIDYSPKDIYGYSLTDGRYYISKKITIDSVAKHLFVEFLVDGIVDLFYVYYNGESIYFVERDNEIYELSNNVRIVESDDKTYTKKSNQYKGILKYLLKDAPELKSRIDGAHLSHNSLINITSDYHSYVCEDQDCMVYKLKKEPTSIRIGAKAGVSFISFSEMEMFSYNYYPGGISIPTSLGFETLESQFYTEFGLFINKVLPFNIKNLSIQYEIGYSSWNTKLEILDIISRTYTISNKSINNDILLKYKFALGKINPFFHVGIFYNYFIESEFNFESTIDERLPVYFEFMEKYDSGFNIGLGIDINLTKKINFLVDVRYRRGLRIHYDGEPRADFSSHFRTDTYVVSIYVPFYNRN